MDRRFNKKNSKISKKQKKEEIISSLLYTFGFLLFLISIVSFIFLYLQTNIQNKTDSEQFYELESMQLKIQSCISRLETNLVHFAELQLIEDFLIFGDYKYKSEIEEYFIKTIDFSTRPELPTFDQIRILSVDGMELIRVELGNNEKAVIVSNNQLSNVSDQSYYLESTKLEADQGYMSPLNLNKEKNQIEYPPKPVIRVSKSIVDDAGEIRGYLIINQLFSSIFSKIDMLNMHENDLWFLLNQDGYYLNGPEPSKTFGFMREETKNIGFFSDYPNIWNNTDLKENGKYNTDNGILFTNSFNLEESSIFDQNVEKIWHLVMMVSHKNYYREHKLLSRAILLVILFISPFPIFIGWIMGRAIVRNRWYTRKLEKSATHDDMTGLLNHQGAMEQLDFLINLTSRGENPLCTAFLDLNELKIVNDTLGHETGDRLIVTLSLAILHAVRNTDVAARIGGDEFIIFFPDLDEDNSRMVLERIKEEFSSKSRNVLGRESHFSWGISQWDPHNDSAERFISRADKAMYKMKIEMRRKQL